MDKIINALNTMYKIERFATQIYKTQIRAFNENIFIERLVAASANEQEHVDDLYERIIALKGKVSKMGNLFQLAGKILGFATTLMGKIFVFKADIMIEKKALTDYALFLQEFDFDEKSRRVIEKNLEDERLHIIRWQDSIDLLKGKLSTAQ